MRYIVLILISLFVSSCHTYVQVLKVDANLPKEEYGFYYFDNDTIRITYSFWHERGLLTFAVQNKLNIPVYLDWQKSSMVYNSLVRHYWTEGGHPWHTVIPHERVLNPFFGAYNFGEERLGMERYFSPIHHEKNTLIPPGSGVIQGVFLLYRNPIRLPLQTAYKNVPRNDSPNRKTDVYEATFTIGNSPLVFRNFLVFSLSKNSGNPIIVDNTFHIQSVREMDSRHFEKNTVVENQMVKASPFEDPALFYIRVPLGQSVEERKRSDLEYSPF